jgi:hypothetical protein
MIVNRKPDVLPEDSALSISSSAERRQKLNSQVDEFLARGGQVSEIDAGARTLEFSIAQPKRMDGSVPKKKQFAQKKFFVDSAELRDMVRSGKGVEEICAHYVEQLGCSRHTIYRKITAARGEVASTGQHLRGRVAK